MSLKEKHDNLLMEILRETKNPPEFLDAVFGFLNRRTDFFHLYDENTKVGLPPGMASKIIYDVSSNINKIIFKKSKFFRP